MAVPKERVEVRLKAFAGRANLSNKRIDEIAARLCSLPADDADDAAIDAVITNADAIYPFKEIAAQDDKIIGLETKLKPVPNPTPTPQPEPTPTPTPTPAPSNDAPEWAKELIKQNATITSELEALKSGKIVETKRASAAEAFGKSEVLKALKDDLKPAWLNRIDVNSETPIEDQIMTLETEYTTMVQSFADSIGYSGPAPANGVVINKANPEMIKGIVDDMRL